jgi:transposase InsO family protein
MPWQEKHIVSLRLEFVKLASQEGVNKRELCRRFGISPKTGYKWLQRDAQGEGSPSALHDRSRRPLASPRLSATAIEQAVVRVREAHASWGGRKIARRLHDLGQAEVAPSTVTNILHRHGLIGEPASKAATAWHRFEHPAPNALWQIDFKGDFATLAGRCHALTLLDDYSRFNLTLTAGTHTGISSVQPVLQQVMRRYGMPVRLNADNGAPWGSPSAAHHGLSQLSVWLIRLGIHVSHSTPYHPQTNGKLERFHRSLNTEVIAGRSFTDQAAVQHAFDHWRDTYNCIRPHESIGMGTPVQRYRASPLTYPEVLPAIEYADGDIVLRVNAAGLIRFQGRKLRMSEALKGLPVALRADTYTDGCFDVLFCHQRFLRLDLRNPSQDD